MYNNITQNQKKLTKSLFSPTLINYLAIATKCTDCPKLALQCHGDQFILSPGTWRFNVQTLVIWKCDVFSACIGGQTYGNSG